MREARFIVSLSMIALGAVVAPAARADVSPAAPAAAAAAPPRFDHGGQLGLAFMPGIGYRMIVRYDEDQICVDARGPDSKWVCTNDVPLFLDVGGSYGITSGIDLIADVRLGIARDDAIGIGRQFALAPGVRFWLDRDRAWKFFTALQAVYDGTKQSQAFVSDHDWGVRNANGVMFDPDRRWGVFLQLGTTLGFSRWFRMEVDAGVGVQVRFF